MAGTILEGLRAGKCTLIAEIGVNYYDIAVKEGITDMEAAKLMCRKAQEAGIHAVKFQTYKAGTLAAHDSPSYWDRSEEPTASQYELFKKFDHFGEAEYVQLKEYCDEIGIEFLSVGHIGVAGIMSGGHHKGQAVRRGVPNDGSEPKPIGIAAVGPVQKPQDRKLMIHLKILFYR